MKIKAAIDETVMILHELMMLLIASPLILFLCLCYMTQALFQAVYAKIQRREESLPIPERKYPENSIFQQIEIEKIMKNAEKMDGLNGSK